MITFFSIIPFYLCPPSCVNKLTYFSPNRKYIIIAVQRRLKKHMKAWVSLTEDWMTNFFVRLGEPFWLWWQLRYPECNNKHHINMIQGLLWTVKWLLPLHKARQNRVLLYLRKSPPCWGPLLPPFLPHSRFVAVSIFTLILVRSLSAPPFYHHQAPIATAGGWKS